ncbi:hypothetical protein CYLTODRAFT_419466 [Cylindrobasidium torrendii FP15055 ss-10]|uniref:Condensin complex subunit 2 n=1 Tax=Cylindrobasidium torrendii FP15055 ss-10 TaxID=1314674 RepID=A0A0D7BJZ9_9AGAR|nr:hypothetical protein CYLTODRAFT_419466 [Cylindrobasidium torrendii FP15055 ss-10]
MPRARFEDDASEDEDMYENETDVEEAMPKPKRTGSRKSIGNDATVHDFNLKDDREEIRKRRQSTKAPAGAAPPDEAGPSRPKKRVTLAPSMPKIDVSNKELMNTNFESWLKMHTDGKITAANSWSLYLIDYFHDGTVLRNNQDGSVNFQRASYTLDGCVKIWTSRVDSVGTDTTKLANNLASGRQDFEGESDEEGVDGDQTLPKKKRNYRPTATLKDAATLRNKKIEADFAVDPLFKKTSADFDEGGAQGLLMNHLNAGVGQDGALRVVFDASDSQFKDDHEVDKEQPPSFVNLAALRRCLPDFESLEICPDLSKFSFQRDGEEGFSVPMTQEEYPDIDDDNAESPAPFDIDHEIPSATGMDNAPETDFYANMNDDNDDEGFGFNDDHFDDSSRHGDDDGEQGGANGFNGPSGSGDGTAPFDASKASAGTLHVGPGGENVLAGFDEDSRNWAGPQYFKLGRAAQRDKERLEKAKPKKKGVKKEPVMIQFAEPEIDDLDAIIKKIHEAPKNAKSHMLPKKRQPEKSAGNRLPDDMHFSSHQLISLFTKPKYTIMMKGRSEPTDGEVDQNWFANQETDQEAGDNDGPAYDDPAGGHFDDDDGDAVGDYLGEIAGPSIGPADVEDMPFTSSQAPRVRPPVVNYARRVKRVDVRRLKDNIWKGLEIITSHQKTEDGMDVDEGDATDPTVAREFKDVIVNLQDSYAQESIDDISTSYVFICLLHLANEQGLRLDNGVQLAEDEDPGEDSVKNLKDVKVYRDPNAVPAA